VSPLRIVNARIFCVVPAGARIKPPLDTSQLQPITTRPQNGEGSRHALDDAGCEEVTIEDIFDDGAIVELLDGRRLRVTAGDDVTASVWVAPVDALLCNDNKLINKDDHESVEVEPD